MEPYIIVLLLNIVLAYFAERNYVKNSKMSYLFISFIVLINTVFSGCRDFGIGIDTTVYIDKYFENAYGLSGFANISDTDNDFGFWCLAYIANLLSDDSQSMLFAVALFINLFVFLSLYQYKNIFNLNLCIATLMFDVVFFCHTLNLMRQFCAISLLLFAFAQFVKKRYLIYILLQIIAISFHKTSFLFLIVPITWYISLIESGKIKIIYSLLVIAFLILSITSFFYVLSFIGDTGIINEIYAERYSESGNYIRNEKATGTGIVKYSIIAFNLLYIIYARKKNVIDKFLFFFILITYIIMIMLKELGLIVSYIDRLAMYFSVIFILLESKILSSKQVPMVANAMILFILFWEWYQLYIVGGGGEIYPYKSLILGIK